MESYGVVELICGGWDSLSSHFILRWVMGSDFGLGLVLWCLCEEDGMTFLTKSAPDVVFQDTNM